MRGEYYLSGFRPGNRLGSPPLARGILLSGLATYPSARITPACAGNTRYNNGIELRDRDHPRLRGEYPQRSPYQLRRRGSPPLARGIPVRNVKLVRRNRITPACAGNTQVPQIAKTSAEDHPRLRGEYTKKIPYLQPFPDLHL